MKLTIPKLSFVVLIGVSGSGKSTFARKHFKPTEILSSDYCRGLVSDDENSQAATNVQIESRKPLVEIAREFHCLPVAIVLDLPERVAHDRNKARPDRDFGPHVIRQQAQQLHRSLRGLEREGFRHVHVLKSLEDIEAAVIERQPLWNNLKQEHGPFDIIGDVHGCFDELVELLGKLGYETGKSAGAWHHPEGRKMVFVGDLVDRGPKIPEVVRLVMDSVNFGSAFCVPGNHDMKFMRKIWGKDVQITHGLAESLAQFEAYEQHYRGFSRVAADSIHKLVSHYLLDDGKLVVAHAGMKESMQGRGSGAVREFALFGETTGETDEFSLPARYNWAAEYRGTAAVVYGHTPVPEPEWLNRTINIDTGCVFGGKLTALRYPEKELVSVPAKQTYGEPRKPFLPNDQLAGGPPALLSAQQQNDDLLDLADMMGKRIVSTRLHGNVTIREENSIAALEVMSRFAANPKWLIYLPPTMSPSETSQAPGLLEHPAEAFAYFRHTGVPRVVCEEKHMGSRAVVIVCRNEDAARKNFGVTGEGIGICYTRTGRRFFDNVTLEAEFLERVRAAATAAGFWDEFKTDWLCLDCKRMPWSAKAQELVKQQYAAVGASAQATLAAEVAVLKQTAERGLDVSELLAHTTARSQMVSDYIEAYRRYCWPVNSVNDLKLAPFHLLASEGAVHTDKPNDWHMQTLACLAGGIIDPRLHRIVAAQPYPLLFATISGAHLYGFPSPDSDFDLRGAHVLPLDAVVGLEIRDETIQQEMIVPPDESEGRARHSVRAENGKQSDGAQGTDAPYQNNSLEMDIVSHDVRKFFGLLLKKNGYVLEQLFSPLIVSTTPEHAKLKEICRAQLNPRRSRGNEAHSSSGESQNLLTSAATGVITKHHSLHYFGFAETQWKLFLKESPRRVKPLLYVYRVLLTGIHLMRTGEVQANLFTLNKEFRLPHVADLVARKLAGPEKSKLDDADIVFHESEYQRLRGELQAAHDASQLPDRPSDETRAALNDLLVRVRLQSTRNPAP